MLGAWDEVERDKKFKWNEQVFSGSNENKFWCVLSRSVYVTLQYIPILLTLSSQEKVPAQQLQFQLKSRVM